MALAAIHVKKPREAQIWNCCTENLVLRILPDSNKLELMLRAPHAILSLSVLAHVPRGMVIHAAR